MSRQVFSFRTQILTLMGVALSILPVTSLAQTACPTGEIGTLPSCVTSNLGRVLLVHGGESSDHDPATSYNMKHIQHLDSMYSIPVDTADISKTTATTLTSANLAKYNLMIWFNVYETANFLTSTYENNVKQWFEAGHGLGCYHQCVKVETGPGIWTWYDTLMGQPYTTYAAVNVTGPVYVDSEGVQSGFTPAQYAGQKFTWSDEWYDYSASPRGMPGVKIVLTTRDTAFHGTFNSNTAMKSDHVLSWTHQIDGGRFYLQGLYHPTINPQGTTIGNGVQTNMQPSGISFVDSMFLVAQQYLAGYTGCMDTSYWEYSPMATNQGTNSCVSPRSGPSPAAIVAVNAFSGVDIGNMKVSISASGRHTVELFDVHGRMILAYHGVGPQEYDLSEIHQPGVYFVKVMTSNLKKPVSRQIFLL